MRAQFLNELEFNFDKNPTDKYRGGFKKEISFPPSENLRKKGGLYLNLEEEKIRERHLLKIRNLQEEIYNYESEIQDLENELEDLNILNFNEGELEEFYAEVQNKYGEKALDILNSGYSNEEKIKAIDELNPTEDFGKKEFWDLMNDYNYYHSAEVDNTKLEEELELKIKKLERQKKEKQNIIDKLEIKIYNLENY